MLRRCRVVLRYSRRRQRTGRPAADGTAGRSGASSGPFIEECRHANNSTWSDRAYAGRAGARWKSSRSTIRGRTRCWCASSPRASAIPIWGSRAAPTATSGFPFLLGHEGAGIVEAVGPGVQHAEGRRSCHPGLARAVRQLPLLPGRPAATLCAASLNAEKRMRTEDGVTLNPVLGIGTFCTHTLVHAAQAIPIDGRPAAGPDVADRLRRDDRRRRGALHGRGASRAAAWRSSAAAASATA